MRLLADINRDYFMIYINGHPITTDDDYTNNIAPGDHIRIVTNYRRVWTVNGHDIALQDKEPLRGYQNIYTFVPRDESVQFHKIILDFPDVPGQPYGDVLPVSIAPAKLICPDGWFFLKEPEDPLSYDISTFEEDIRLWKLGELFGSVSNNPGYVFKRMDKMSDYTKSPYFCGVLKKRGKYVFLYHSLKEASPLVEEIFDDIDTLIHSVEARLMEGHFD